MNTLLVLIRYPLRRDDVLVLRTEEHWDRDVQPIAVDGSGAIFRLAMPQPNLALKPVLYRDGKLHWSVGENYVLTAHEPDPEIWPFFFSAGHGEVSPLLRISGQGRSHAVRVYTPPGYAENELRTFPVLYMQDGRNLFFPEEAFGGQEWEVDETMDRLDRMNAVRKIIVVGVAPNDRMEDYTAPGFEAYGAYLAEVLKPWVDAHYRTRPSPSDTVVCGSSLGGVVSLHLAWAHPEVFGGAMCLSSTFGYADDLFIRIAAEPKAPVRLYLDSGWPRDNFDATNAMRDLLVSRGFVLGDDLLALSFPEGTHREASWADRIHLPFQFFFGRAWAAARARRGRSASRLGGPLG